MKFLKLDFGAALAASLMSGVEYILNKVAYDSATWLASGDFDNRPLMFTEDAGEYFRGVALDGVADALGAISSNVEFLKKYKINLCMPPDIRLQIWLKLALFEVYEPKPRCSMSQITQAYKRIGTPGYWQNVGVGFTAGQNDLSFLAGAYGAMKEISLTKAEDEEKNLKLKGLALAPTDAVTGKPTTAIRTVEGTLDDQAPGGLKEEVVINQALTYSDVFAKGEYGWGLVKEAGQLFLNTLVIRSLEKLVKVGFVSMFPPESASLEELRLGSLEDVYASGGGRRESAERAFADFLVPRPVAVDSYNYVSEMANCGDEKNRGYLTCSIDQGLQAALAQAEAGAPLTIKEAIDKKYLHPDRVLYGPDFTDKNSSFKCALEGYCYSNLVKLRLWRILPVGFELAAKQSKPDSRVTLRNALAHFNDVSNSSGLQHLIDPDWVIKAPAARCDALTYGSIYLAGQNQRAQYCADPQSCVKEDANGQCAKETGDAAFGYCLREKNVWRLGGDSCDAQYNTCTAYTGSKGGKVAYLASTLDKGFCSAQNAGCRGYSLARDAGLTGWEAGKSIFLNKKAEQCVQTNEGCSKFIKADGSEVNLKKALSLLNPDNSATYGYNCYGERNGVVGGDGSVALSGGLGSWPVNKADLYKVFATWSEKQKTECGRFAGVCSAEEVGCERYTPDNGNPPIPGILSANDVCPGECASYETYIEQPTVFSATAVTASFIPATARACQSNYVGCDEFVNLENQAGEAKSYFSELRACSKGEADPNDEGAFYTWEGSDTSGYQLKSYAFKTKDGFYNSNPTLYIDKFGQPQDLDSYAVVDQSMKPPTYNTINPAKLAEYAQKCNRDVYKYRSDPGANLDPDCREFYDKDGKKAYRLYSKTITIDAARCQKFRKGESTQASCTDTGGAWDAQGFCIYLAIAAEGRSCPAAANGCRAYKGNAGNNFQVMMTETYESGRPGQSDNQGNQYSAESLSLNGVSLKVISGVLKIGASGDFPKDSAYLVSFWAKGNLGDLTASVYSSESNGAPKTVTGVTLPAPQIVKINSEWAAYTVGPFNISWDQNQASTTFKLSNSGGAFFIDNLVEKKMTDNIYQIKNSWNTPVSCDNTFEDPYGVSAGGTDVNPLRLVPQAQLGCANYKNSKFETKTVKSFTSLCREEAVGCEKLTDTFNNAATSTYYYNVTCKIYNATAPVDRGNISNQPLSCKDIKGTERCSVAPGQRYCLFDTAYDGTFDNGETLGAASGNKQLDGLTGGTTVDADNNQYNTVVWFVGAATGLAIPADRAVYLVNDQAHQCATENLGCSAMGLVDYLQKDIDVLGGIKVVAGSATSTQTAYLKNSPDKYKDILCSQEAEGCESYATTKGGLAYFRDPIVWGNKLCEWQENTIPHGTSIVQTGWFFKGTNVGCYNENPDALPEDDYKIKPIGDSNYKGRVGICPVAQDTCSEFVDPLATSPLHPAGEPYFVLNNEKLDKSSCQGQASLKKGCILFDETAKGSKLWSASTTYAASQVKNYETVAPIDCGRQGEKGTADNCAADTADANNANLVLKVTRDRACGEWLACKSSYTVWDDKLGKYKKVCVEIGRCNQAPAADSSESCANWIDGTHEYAGKILTAPTNPGQPASLTNIPLYQSRQIGWAGMDFSGFSRPDWLPLEELAVVDITFGAATKDWRLVKKISGKNNLTDCENAGGFWTGFTTPRGFCIKPSNGAALSGGNLARGGVIQNETSRISCRSYPEASAPLPNTQSLFDTQPINVSNTNLCSENIGEWKNLKNPFMVPERPTGIANSTAVANRCDCNYTKAEYEGKTLFWQYDNPNKDGSIVDKRARKTEEAPRGVLPGICTDGPYIGMACSGAADCSRGKVEEGAQGTCAPLTKASRLLGWQGICIEEDTSQALYGEKGKHPCLAWLPVDQTAGMYDIFNQHKEAGFDPQSSQLGFIDGPYYCTRASRWEKRPGYQIDNVSGYLDCDGGNLIDGQASPDGDNARPVYNPPLNESETRLQPYFGLGLKQKQNPDNTSLSYEDASDQNLYSFRSCTQPIVPDKAILADKMLPSPQLLCSNNYDAWNLRQFIREPDADAHNDKFTMSFDCRPKSSGKAGWYNNPSDKDPATGNWDKPAVINEPYAPNHFVVRVPVTLPEIQFPTGVGGVAPDYSSDTFSNKNPKGESHEWRCTKMYKVGDNGDSKANTQLLWEKRTEIFNNNCAPVGALAVFTDPPGKGAVIVDSPNFSDARKECLKGKITDDPDLPESDGAFYQGGTTTTLAGIKTYFVKTYEEWRQSITEMNNKFQSDLAVNDRLGYTKEDGYNPEDNSENYSGATPKMAAVGPCTQADNCKEDNGANMTVKLSATPGFGSTLLKFYAWADDSHMPLRSVVVDWGDGEQVGDGVIGYYRNHRGLDALNKPFCATDNTSFGLLLGKTCDISPFNFSHTYTCFGASSVSGDCGGDGRPTSNKTSCWLTNAVNPPNGACVFIPRVSLQDNWGWCNGSCPAAPGGTGCYDASVKGAGECDRSDTTWLAGQGPWTPYSGRIIVPPRPPQ